MTVMNATAAIEILRQAFDLQPGINRLVVSVRRGEANVRVERSGGIETVRLRNYARVTDVFKTTFGLTDNIQELRFEADLARGSTTLMVIYFVDQKTYGSLGALAAEGFHR